MTSARLDQGVLLHLRHIAAKERTLKTRPSESGNPLRTILTTIGAGRPVCQDERRTLEERCHPTRHLQWRRIG